MSEDDPFMIEEAHYKARIFLDKMAADGDRTDDLESPAFVMFLEIERGGAKRTRVSSPMEREALVTKKLACILDDYGSKE